MQQEILQVDTLFQLDVKNMIQTMLILQEELLVEIMDIKMVWEFEAEEEELLISIMEALEEAQQAVENLETQVLEAVVEHQHMEQLNQEEKVEMEL